MNTQRLMFVAIPHPTGIAYTIRSTLTFVSTRFWTPIFLIGNMMLYLNTQKRHSVYNTTCISIDIGSRREIKWMILKNKIVSLYRCLFLENVSYINIFVMIPKPMFSLAFNHFYSLSLLRHRVKIEAVVVASGQKHVCCQFAAK